MRRANVDRSSRLVVLPVGQSANYRVASAAPSCIAASIPPPVVLALLPAFQLAGSESQLFHVGLLGPLRSRAICTVVPAPGGKRTGRATPASCNACRATCWHTGSVQLRCVIVDDDDEFLTVAQALLERGGLTVAGVAHSSAEAVQRIQALRPDVVLIDIRLGRESGFDVARRLADNGHPAALIMISTHAGEDYAELIAESPATGFLPKAELSAVAIRRILGTN